MSDDKVSIEIKPVSSQEQIDSVAELARRIWTEHYVPIIGQAQVDYMLTRLQSSEAIAAQIREGMQYFLVRSQSAPEQFLGYFAFSIEKDMSLFLSKIYVVKAARGQKIGSRCMDYIQQVAKQLHCARIRLTVNKHNRHAMASYEALGFERTRAIVKDIGAGFIMDDFEYVRKL